MAHDIYTRITKAISINLHDKAGQLITTYGLYLSKREIGRIEQFMKQYNTYPRKVVEYIFYVSPHRFDYASRSSVLWAILVDACMHGSLDTAKLLIQDPTIQLESLDSTILCTAFYNGRVEIIKVLLESERTDPGCRNDFPIRSACENNYIEIVRILLADRSGKVDPTCFENLPLRYACINGCVEIIRLLLENNRVVLAGLSNVICEVDRGSAIPSSTRAEIINMLQSKWDRVYQKIEIPDPL